jgi:nucleoside 2-deoxyribosyltransferase
MRSPALEAQMLCKGVGDFPVSKYVPKVYLAGAISGLTYGEGQSWREYTTSALAIHGINGYSPLRAKDYLSSVGKIEQSYANHPLSCDRGIMTRDRYDVSSCDAVLFYLLGAERVSIGTMIEFGWADAWRKPTVVVMEETGNIHEHPMVREATGFRVTNLEDGIAILDKILNPQYGGVRG